VHSYGVDPPEEFRFILFKWNPHPFGTDKYENQTRFLWRKGQKTISWHDYERRLELKQRETREPGTADADEELQACQAIGEVLKQEPVHTSIHFAERIRFSSSFNRHNPVISFDPITCHALLNRMQRHILPSKYLIINIIYLKIY
jgi:hypothetical protein